MLSPRRLAYLALFGSVFIWGIHPIISKLSFHYVTPIQLLTYRYFIAAPLSLPILFYYHFINKLSLPLKQLFTIIGIEFLMSLGLLLYYLGLNLTTATEASIISLLGPVFTTIAGIIFLHEHEEKHEWLGLLIALVGSIIIIIEPIITNHSLQAEFSLLGNSLILIHVIRGALTSILVKKHFKHIPKLYATALGTWISLALMLLLAYLSHQSPDLAHLALPSVSTTAIYMAIFGTYVAFTLHLQGLNLIEASEASLFSYLEPLIVIPLALVVLQESFSWPAVIGIPLILLGLILAESRHPHSLNLLKRLRTNHHPHHYLHK